MLLGVLLLGEPFGIATLLGMGAILASVALIIGVRSGGAKEKEAQR